MTKYCLLPKCIVKKEKEKHVELEHLSLISIEALHEIKCSCGMNSLHGACTDNSLTVSFKETSQHLKEGVRVGRSCGVVCVCVWCGVCVCSCGEGHRHKSVSVMHITMSLFLLLIPPCTTLRHLKQTLASPLPTTSKSTLVCCVSLRNRHLPKPVTVILL